MSLARRPGPWLLGLALLLAAGGALLVRAWPRSSSSPPASPTQVSEALPEGLVLGWPTGWRYRYRFALQQDSTTRLPLGTAAGDAPTLDARVRLGGELAVEPLALDPQQGAVARLRLLSLAPRELQVAGQALLTDEATGALADASAILRLQPDGAVRSVEAEPGCPEILTRVLHLVISEWQVQLQPGRAAWQVAERTQLGVADSTYTLTALTPGRATLQRVRARYRSLDHGAEASAAQRLDARAEIAIGLDGVPVLLSGHEALTAGDEAAPLLRSKLRVRFELVAREPWATDLAQVAAPSSSARALFDFAGDAAVDRQHLRQRIDGLSTAQLLADLQRAALHGRVPEHNRWLWRATGLLQAEPGLAGQVADFARQPGIAHEARGLALDLLVGAGTAEAQAALLAALDDPTLRTHPRYRAYLQRLSLLAHPAPEVVAFLRDLLVDAEGLDRAAAHNALGAVADHLARAGDLAAAQDLGELLAHALQDARDPATQALVIEAIGNAGLSAQAELLAPHASSGDPRVRSAVASALRKMDGPLVRELLLRLSADREPAVASRALESLARQTLQDPELARLRGLVEGQQVPELAYQALVNLLQPRLGTQALARGILELILQQPLQDDTVKTRIRALLGA